MEETIPLTHEERQEATDLFEGQRQIAYILSHELPPDYQGNADPATCPHDWYEDTSMIYTSSPPQRRQVCRLCGQSRFVYIQQHVSPRWRKVI